jgi:hypothetical protein
MPAFPTTPCVFLEDADEEREDRRESTGDIPFLHLAARLA